MTSNITKCVQRCVQQNINKLKIKETDILLTKWKLSQEKNHSGAAKPRISTIQKTRLVTK
jgi:hypothetical protein